jgi:C-terminal processing protease CtpA/Prc
MGDLECPPVAERLSGLSLLWQEANYNFAFFDRVPELDWEAAYREMIPQVIATNDLDVYYELLERFVALLKDGHSGVFPPRSVYEHLDQPKLTLMNIENRPVVTNASRWIGERIPIGSTLCEIDGLPVEAYLDRVVLPRLCENAPHRRRDRAVSLLLLGRAGSQISCKWITPGGKQVEFPLLRNRKTDPEPWLRPAGAPQRSEFVELAEYYFTGNPFSPFEFRKLDKGLGYVALNTFMDKAVVKAFEEALPALKACSALIVDLRKNMGGNTFCVNSIVSHFIHQPTETCWVRSRKHIAMNKAHGTRLKDTRPAQWADLSEAEQADLLCYRSQWFHEESWGQIQPAAEILSQPIVFLTSSETSSGSDDFLNAFRSGKGEGIQIGGSTSGSSGQPLEIPLPGGGLGYICTVRMPETEEIWQKGIQPQIAVEPTIEDIICDEDRVLQTAVRSLCG